MGIRVDSSKFKAELDKFERFIEEQMAGLLKGVEDQANRDLQTNLFVSVYGTTPGNVYIRTGNLKSVGNTSATDISRNGVYEIKLKSDVEYASDIEYGSSRSAIDEGLLRQLSEASGGKNISFGRSGINYMLPGPFVMPAAVKSRIMIENGFIKIINKGWK